jgi:hypothetical protein
MVCDVYVHIYIYIDYLFIYLFLQCWSCEQYALTSVNIRVVNYILLFLKSILLDFHEQFFF